MQTSTSEAGDRRRVPPWIAAAAVWLALALVSALQNYVYFAVEGHPIGAGAAVGGELRVFGAWAVLTPAIVIVTRAARRRGGGAWLLLHAPAIVGVALAHAAILVAVTVAAGELAPGDRVRSALWRVLGGNFSLEVIVYGAVALVVEAVDWARAYRRREADAARLEADLARTRLDALRAQLQPHFLFNALHAVSSLVDTDPAAARRTIVRLSDLLRATLEVDAREIPLREELALLGRYLDIVRVRFADRLRVTVDVPDDLGDLYVPPLVLQPLVENALTHGAGARPGVATLAITARRDGDRLRLTVADDGVGPGPTIVERVGLGATRARLVALHGAAGTLALGPRDGGGAEAVIELPASRAPAGGPP